MRQMLWLDKLLKLVLLKRKVRKLVKDLTLFKLVRFNSWLSKGLEELGRTL